MADASKAHKLKLANSRKRFKELQELKKKKISDTSDTAGNNVQEVTPADSLTSSTHSSINTETALESETTANTQLHNYFDNADYADNAIFFDSLAQKSDKNYLSNVQQQPSSSLDNVVSNIVETPKLNIKAPCDENYSLFDQTNHYSYVKETQQIIRPSTDGVTIGDPEIRPNEVIEHHKNTENDRFSEKSRQNLDDYLQGEPQQVSDAENIAIKNEIAQNSSKAKEGVLKSNVDSLRNLSNQMAQLEPQSYNISNSITDLEKRSIELALCLEQEKCQSQQHTIKITELESKIFELEHENQVKDRNILEINQLSEELQCHSQTIRLLVAEKTELSNGLSQLEQNLKNKSSECDELQARLKASRSRAFEFEQELNMLKSERVHKESNGHDHNRIVENLRRDIDNLSDEKEELKQDLLEVREKLKNGTEEAHNLQKLNSELSGKLSLANIKIQQLASADHQVEGAEVEKLLMDKVELEKEITSLNNLLKSITKERDESTSHYQHYTEELNSQLVTLQEQYQKLQLENENLSIQEQNRIRHIGDLERQLQSIQNERVTFSSSNLTDSNLKNEFDMTRELCVQLQMEKTELEENYTKTLNEKEMLLKELSAKNDSLEQLESMVEQLRGNQPDSVKLLATMESDKVAAARAVQQNKELKEQLESMTEVFEKMDNDKVELTEKLGLEQSSNKDLLDKLQKTELQLNRLTDAIEIKDRELSHLRETSTELNKQVLQQEQLADRLRHYEAHDNSTHSLQNDLQEAKQTIVRLTNEINHQRNHGITFKHQDQEMTANEDVVVLRKQLEELKFKNQELETKLDRHPVDNNNFNINECVSECSDREHILEKEEVMKRLEDKVKRTMQDIADLTEEKQRLEHLVLQLQGETETIGEYVALYQHQRMILKQKVVETDEQLHQLATDREQIKVKLEKLNQLVGKLIKEKGLNPEILGQYEKLHEKEVKRMEEEINVGDTNAAAAEEILALLSEIKSSNLVEPRESIHHCPFCSGQLITV